MSSWCQDSSRVSAAPVVAGIGTLLGRMLQPSQQFSVTSRLSEKKGQLKQAKSANIQEYLKDSTGMPQWAIMYLCFSPC